MLGSCEISVSCLGGFYKEYLLGVIFVNFTVYYFY